MTSTAKFMPWVDFLPVVGTPILNERDRLARMLADAERLENEARELRERVRQERGDLFMKIAKMWTLYDIETAAKLSGLNGHPFPVEQVADANLRAALRAVDGGLTALDVLQAFERGQVIRPAGHVLTASDAECRATLQRVLDWWNVGALPVLEAQASA